MIRIFKARRLAILGAIGLATIGFLIAISRNSASELYVTAPVEHGSIATHVKATGIVEPVMTVDVSSQLSGRVADVLVNFNDEVKQDQVLARLDPQAYDARVSEARAALKVAQANALLQKASLERASVGVRNAETARQVEEEQFRVAQTKQEELERDYQRFAKLSQSGSVSERDMTQAKSLRDAGAGSLKVIERQIKMKAEAIETARAEIAMAEANLANAAAVVEQKQAALDQAQVDRGRTEIRAPIDGIIIKRDVNPGQTVAVTLEAKTLFKIGHDLREMEVRGRIDEADVGKLKPGQRATFTVDAYPDRSFKGQVLQIRKSPETTQNVVTYTAIISAPNPENLLLPGMTATLQINISETAPALKVPVQALRFRSPAEKAVTVQGAQAAASGSSIWLVDQDGTAQAIPVRLGESDGNSIMVFNEKLHEGQRVAIGLATPRSQAGWFGIRLGQ
jgi:HlyD family secretion protein